MPLLLYFATGGAFLFGYARPVPVNFGNLRNPKRDMVWVALAGPGVQLGAGAVAIAVHVLAARHHRALLYRDGQGRRAGQCGDVGPSTCSRCRRWMAAHPGRPAALERQARRSARIEPWGFFIVMGLVIAGVVGTWWLRPLMWLLPPSPAAHRPWRRLARFDSRPAEPHPRFLTGITTTGTPHLGNYVGSIRPSVAASLQARRRELYFLADYHALIKCDELARIQRSTLEIAAAWLAAAWTRPRHLLPPVRHPEIPELTWLLTCVTGKGLLNRAHAYKAAVDKNTAAGEDPMTA